jgi:hypothetical protein
MPVAELPGGREEHVRHVRRPRLQSILYPAKGWTESAAFDNSFAASLALGADSQSRLSLVRHPFGQPISAAPADPSPRLSSLMKRDELQYERNVHVILNQLAQKSTRRLIENS